MRTKGALNKPKFIGVKLSDLNRVFQSDTIIKIDANYAKFLSVPVSTVGCEQVEIENNDNKISFEVVSLEN